MNINNDSLRKDIGNFIKNARKDKSLTGTQLGGLLNVSQQQISRYERGKTSLTIDSLSAILIILEKDWSDLFQKVMVNYSNGKADEYSINNDLII
ncbi:helix-turn-helix domain-containing protein [Providencia sp. JUb39]|uniref:helix-turn-helix domain-containing protein n=1 Tax=Providencia sp. JUb39 TaxID=2724165 RepID=UPI00164D8EE1|nr:helix-turn-helix transcriptional regulator [Providencia sp. JUb39]MBC5791457.1 helix-turn-helix transcriptional regulator [Providencia sp. JUb39]